MRVLVPPSKDGQEKKKIRRMRRQTKIRSPEDDEKRKRKEREQEGAGWQRDDPPQHVANEAAALQAHLVEHHEGARRAEALDEHRG